MSKKKLELEKVGDIVSRQIELQKAGKSPYFETNIGPQSPREQQFYGRVGYVIDDSDYESVIIEFKTLEQTPKAGVYQKMVEHGFFSTAKLSSEKIAEHKEKLYEDYKKTEVDPISEAFLELTSKL